MSKFNPQNLSKLILRCLREGKSVEVDGLGTFHPGKGEAFHFQSHEAPRVFIAYAIEDAEKANKIFDAMQAAGMNPWMDRRKLLPGQNWARAIESVMETSDFFLACLSQKSVTKRGCFQSELRYALELARRVPLEDAFLVPIRLDECRVPARIKREWQYIDLYPDWEAGLQVLLNTLQKEWKGPRRCHMQPISGC